MHSALPDASAEMSQARAWDAAAERTVKHADDVRALLDTVSLYIHIPFCHVKCHYCDFNSYPGMLGWRGRYVAALEQEIMLAGRVARLPYGDRRRCRTVFFGGGTPSLLAGEEVARLVQATRLAFAVDAEAEITLEANPGTLERGHLSELRQAGINRLSMGAQSFDPALLGWMNRIHTAEEIVEAMGDARAAGFANINLDFIFALPAQTLDTWADTLRRALELHPEHLSLYSLIVEEGTPLHTWVAEGRVQPADEDLAADMYELAERQLAEAGYLQYEISNWALPGRACRHNLTYWRNLPYIGLGAGAHGWFAGRRYAEARPIRDFIARVQAASAEQRDAAALPAGAVVESETIGSDLEMAETAMLGLRLVGGLSLSDFARRYGQPFEVVFGERLADVMAQGLLERQGDRLRLTERGRLLGNEVFARVLP